MREDDALTYVHPEFEALSEENAILRAELAAMYEEFEYLNRHVVPMTQTSYLIKLGALRAELLQTQMDVMRIRRRIAILRSHIERGTTVDESVLNARVDREFHDWDERLLNEARLIEQAKARFSSLAPSEDEDEVRSLYRILIRRLHPDVNLDQSEGARSLWGAAGAAYYWGDVFQLKSLLIIAEDYPECYDLPCNMSNMRKSNTIMKENMQAMAEKIKALKGQTVFEWKKVLDDPARLAAEQEKLLAGIQRARSQYSALRDLLASLESVGMHRLTKAERCYKLPSADAEQEISRWQGDSHLGRGLESHE